MKLNSDETLKRARLLLNEHGGSWEAVRRAGKRRPDGTIEIEIPRLPEDDSTAKPARRGFLGLFKSHD